MSYFNQSSFLLNTSHGKLEMLIEIHKQEDDHTHQGIGIVCHPHPLHGGTFNNKVVSTVAKAFRELNMISVKFNYRGVGNSEGKYDNGIGETTDTLNVIDWVSKHYPHQKIILAGFSFGAYVSYAATQKTSHQIAHLISIAPAVNHANFLSPSPHCPWTVIIAEKDTIVSPQDTHRWLDTLPIKPTVLSFSNATHFFDGQLIELKQQIKQLFDHS